MEQEIIKKEVGYKAADLIQDGMLVGIGTGSTVFFFIERLIERVKSGLRIKAVSSLYNLKILHQLEEYL